MRRTIARRHGSNDAAPVLVESTITRGLQLLLPFAERAGTRAFSLGRPNYGTLVNAPARAWVRRLGRYAIGFGQTNDYVEVQDSDNIDASFPSTIAFWVFVNQYGATVDGTILAKFSNGASSTGAQLRGIRIDDGNFQVTEESTNRLSLSTWVTAGSWHQVAITLTSAKAAIAYVNGISRATATFTGTWFNTNHPLRIGAPQAAFFNSGTTSFDGSIADLGIWSRVLTPTEIRWLADRRNRLYGPPQLSRPWATDLGGGGPITTSPAAVSATWSVVTPALAKILAVAPVAATWSTVAPTLVKSLTPDPLVATWSVVAPSTGLTIVVTPDPVVATWSVGGVMLTKTRSVEPVLATWSIPTATLSKTISPAAVSASWTVSAPSLSKSTTPGSVSAAWSVETPTLTKALTVSAVQAAWTVASVETSHDVPVIQDSLCYDVRIVPELLGTVSVGAELLGEVSIQPELQYTVRIGC